MSLTNSQSKLPYIILPENNLKVLIDTGSSKSFVSDKIANKFYKDLIKKDPFKISSAHGNSIQQYSTKIPCSKIFNLNNKLLLKFHIFNFHKYFDCLLGLDNLIKLNAIIDLNNNLLITPSSKIKIEFLDLSKNSTQINNYITVGPKSEQIIKIKTKNIKNGEIVIPYTKLNNLEIAECITKVINHEALCTIINPSENDITVDLSTPLLVENLENYDITNSNINNFNAENFKFNSELIRTDHMNDEEKFEIIKLIKQYQDIFQLENNNLTFTSKIKHYIKLKDEIPVYTKSYRYPEIHRKEVQSQIQKMLEQNIIRPSHSPWSSPIWIVPKKLDASGKRKWRIVVDYRNLNAKTIDDKYPLPNISELLDKLGRCQYFSTLDLASGFHQIEMAEDDIQKTAFNTENGHYEYVRMPFGLKNAPATFQRVMDNILRGIQNEKCLVYLDDIIIFSTSLQEHLCNLKEVFERLKDANFKIQLDKSEFLRKEVAYLGHIVTPEGVKPNPDKIIAIQNYPLPKNVKQIKGFLGLLGYYRKFIKDFAKITKPLTSCLKKGAEINVNDSSYIKCFETCKSLLTNQPLLQYPDFSKPFNLTTDASNFAIGAILSQGPIGSDLPIAYASRTLNSSETNYSTIEKELLAIVWAVKYFRPYLFGRKFKIITDHKPLQWLFSLKEPNSKLVRWRLKLEEYDYEIIYKKGKLNKNADALSRVEINVIEEDNPPSALVEYIEKFNNELERAGTSNPNFDTDSLIVEPDKLEIDRDLEDSDGNTVHSNHENPIAEIPIIECSVNQGKNQIIISEVNYQPAAPSVVKLFKDKQRILLQISKNNFEQDIINFIRDYIVPKVKYFLYFEDPIYEKFSSLFQKYFKNSQIQLIKCTQKLIDVIDENEINEIIQNYHEGKTNHRGIDETENQIKKQYYWPKQRKSIQIYINNCEICQITKYDRNPLKLKYNVTPTTNKPFQTLHIDSITLEKQKFLTIIDSFSKYAQAYKLDSSQAIEVANNLIKYFSHHCIPEQIISDNGCEFKNSIVKELLELHKIKIHFISSQHPESNGMIERFHSTLVEHIRLLNNQKQFKTQPIDNKVNYAILAYNNSIHSVTKLKPNEILFGHLESNDPFNIDLNQKLLNNYIASHKEKMQLLYTNLNKKIQENKEKYTAKANKNREELPPIPERVFVKNRQKQSKTKNRYKIESIETLNENLKTAKITPTHYNTNEKIHISNIKRPRKIKD